MGQKSQIRVISRGNHLPGLAKAELSLLRRKPAKLASSQAATLVSLPFRPHHRNGLEATLIFASHETRTAVCIHPDGWIMICAQCIAEDEVEWLDNRTTWLLSYTGIAIQAERCTWDLT